MPPCSIHHRHRASALQRMRYFARRLPSNFRASVEFVRRSCTIQEGSRVLSWLSKDQRQRRACQSHASSNAKHHCIVDDDDEKTTPPPTTTTNDWWLGDWLSTVWQPYSINIPEWLARRYEFLLASIVEDEDGGSPFRLIRIRLRWRVRHLPVLFIFAVGRKAAFIVWFVTVASRWLANSSSVKSNFELSTSKNKKRSVPMLPNMDIKVTQQQQHGHGVSDERGTPFLTSNTSLRWQCFFEVALLYCKGFPYK